MLKQRTIKSIVKTVGIGLHSGRKVDLTLRPAAPDTGIVFSRVDLPTPVDIPASAMAIGDTRLASVLQKDGARVSTIEHLMSACAGLGIAKQALADPDEMIEVPGLGERGPRTLSRQALAAVVEPRVEELFSLVQQVVRESGYEELLSSGVVLTGGASMMLGMVELGEDIFLKPVRIGVPEYAGGLADVVRNPRYSTAMGLLVEGRSQRMRGRKVAVQSGSMGQVFTRMKDWFLGNF
jgi:hypothetical protein